MDESDTLRASCARNLSQFAPRDRTPYAAVERWRATAIEGDMYGAGGAVQAVEERVARLLGKPAAVFMPTGTMAQQIAVRVHADRRDARTVAFHPSCHLECHEEHAFEHLHRLRGCPVGAEDRLVELADLEAIDEPIAALVLELPQRMIGAQLPDWPDLVAQTGWARERGAAVHLDGARLWEAQPFYGRPHAEIADLFDTVYVSFYKGLAGIGGCVLAGPGDVIDEARLWRTRHGGLMFSMWPYAVDAMHGLDVEMPAMAGRLGQARVLAADLALAPGIGIQPDPPQTPIFNVLVDRSPLALDIARDRLAVEEDVWLYDRRWATSAPDRTRIEIGLGRQIADFADGEIVRLVCRLRELADTG